MFKFWSTIFSPDPNFVLIEPKSGTERLNVKVPILNFNFKIRCKNIWKKKPTFPFILGSWISKEVPFENVVAMATRKYLSFRFRFQNITYMFLGLRVRGGVVPFLDGLLWRPRLVSPHLAPCEAQVMTTQGLVTQPLLV